MPPSARLAAGFHLSCLALLLLVSVRAQATDYVWGGRIPGDRDHGSTTLWQNPKNWRPNGVPGPGDTATLGDATVSSGADVTVHGLSLSAGTLQGNVVYTVTGAMSWTGGRLLNTTLTVAEGARLILSGEEVRYLSGGVLTNNGTVEWTGAGPFQAGSSATVNNIGLFLARSDASFVWRGGPQPRFINTGTFNWTGTGVMQGRGSASVNNSGLFHVQSDSQAIWLGGAPSACSRFVNTGTFRKSGSSGVTDFGPPSSYAFTNSGVVEVLSGTLRVGSDFRQTDGSLVLNGGSLASPGTITLTGGILTGTGTITGDVANGGLLSPGSPLGQLTIHGDYNQTESGTLRIELGGPNPANDRDRLVITGAAALGGTLALSRVNEYAPTPDEAITILQYASHQRNWQTTGMAGGDVALVPDYRPTELVLVANTIAADETNVWADIVGRDTVRAGREQQFTILYGNLGGADAHGVTIALSGIPEGAILVPKFSRERFSTLPTEFGIPPPSLVPTKWGLVYFLVIPTIPAGSEGSLSVGLTVPNGTRPFVLSVQALSF